jgi:oligopeptide transport system permease protein
MYLGNLFRGDMGPSFIYRDMRVQEILGEGLPVSVQLGLTALIVALGVGTLLGCLAALRQNTSTDYTVIAVATFGITVPNFVVAPVLSLVFAVMLNWLPAQGWGETRQMILPVIALALPQIAIVARLVRGAMIEALRSDHVRTARAYGLPPRMVVVKHALRAAILPAVSYLGPAAAALLTGSIVVEQVFNLPGIGRYFVQGALNRDYTLVMGTVVIVAVFVVLFNLIVDLLYALLDPRVRYD